MFDADFFFAMRTMEAQKMQNRLPSLWKLGGSLIPGKRPELGFRRVT